MKTNLHFRLLTVLSLLLAALPAQIVQADAAKSAAPASLLQFTAGGHALGFAADGMYAATGSHALHVDFTGATAVQPQADSPASTDGKAVPLSLITYTDLWDGITLTYTAGPSASLRTGAGSIYTTTYTLAPGAYPADIRLHYNAPLTLNEDGILNIAFETGAMTESAPIAWQDINGERVPVEVSFRVSEEELRFAPGSYNPRYSLTIDSSLVWNTFLGGSGNDQGNGIAVDGSGTVYVIGNSTATWGSPLRAYGGSTDAFVAKLNLSGGLVWNTFLGANGVDNGVAIAVDGSGNVYVAGASQTTWGSPVRAYTGDYDAFAAKLNSSGGLAWNTFQGGSGSDSGRGIAVDGSGNVYVAGYSTTNWDTPIRAYTGDYDAFAAKLNSSGALTWHTFLGGTDEDQGRGISVDGSGNVYVAGQSTATWGSPLRAYTLGIDTFAAKLSASGGLTWHTFLGGSGNDSSGGIVVSGTSLYVSGSSTATWGSPVRAYNSLSDAYVAKLAASTGALNWNTFLGGSGTDYGSGIAVDGGGNVYVAGTGTATWGSPLRAYTLGYDAFAAKLSSSGTLTSNLFLGGSGSDYGYGIAVDGSGTHVTGMTRLVSWGDPVRAFIGGDDDAFVAKMVFAPPGAFNKLSPASNAYGQAAGLSLDWEASSDATAYAYCIDTMNDNACSGSWISTGTNTFADISGLSLSTTFYWQARATNGFGTIYANGGAGTGTWWTLKTGLFADVPVAGKEWMRNWIEGFYNSGITTGCGAGPLIYCPEREVTRAEMAVFLERAINYPALPYTPPAASHYFSDMPVVGKEWMEAWVDEFYRDGITTGCGAGPIYCPEREVTRAEMAVFVLRAVHGSGYTPPAATGVFLDVPVAGKEWMQPWIEQFYNEGITTGCGAGPLYCPERAVTRAEMAVFIGRAYSIPQAP